MNAQNWSDTLTLLSIMILADEKVYLEEVETFKTAAVKLRDNINPKLMLSESMAFDWFMLHRDDIKITISPLYHEDTVGKLLNNLSTIHQRDQLYAALMQIALSDGHEHAQENSISQRARVVWGLQDTAA